MSEMCLGMHQSAVGQYFSVPGNSPRHLLISNVFFFFQSGEYESKDTSVTWQAPTSDWPVLSL